MAKHVLAGLRPEPLASYLAGLGLIRLLGEQADASAAFFWTSHGLVVDTEVADIALWLTDQYRPTPVLSPWNSGSGFGVKDVEPKRRLARLLASMAPRLAEFRTAVEAAERTIHHARSAGWIKDDGKGDKAQVIQEFRNRCPESLLPWIDACVVLAADKALFPPLLGTGGNDGRFEFSTNFHEELLVVLDESEGGRARSLALAQDLLAGSEVERLAEAPVGQFDPAGAGGQGSSPFGAASSLVNPWRYVLLVEGALLFASGTARRHQHGAGRAAMPFTVDSSPDGSDSGADGEESRGEVWVPAWSVPFTLAEVTQLFGEARASWRGRPARQATDFYAATRALGVARGVDEFVRYGLQQRNGLAFVAVPLDRVRVMDKPSVRLAAQVEDWVSWISRGESSHAVHIALRGFEAAHLTFARDGSSVALRNLLAALTSLEQSVGRSGRVREQIPVRMAPSAKDFLGVLTDGEESPEMRIAIGVASCFAGLVRSSARSMRQILLPIDPGEQADRSRRYGRWRDAPVVPGFGIRPMRRVLADVLAWRSRAAADEDAGASSGAAFNGIPTFRIGVPVPAADLHMLAVVPKNGSSPSLSETELTLWLRACLALDWWGVRHVWRKPEPSELTATLAVLQPLAAGLSRADDSGSSRLALGPDWAVRLAAGQVADVHTDALRRLRQAGWEGAPALRADEPNNDRAARGTAIAAALVPRCADATALLQRYFAFRVKNDAGSKPDVSAHENTNTPELAEEMS